MRFSHAWLKEYVEVEEPPARVGARLTAAGLPLDGIEGSGDAAVYDFDIFTNRPDCMNHLGLAREYAALTAASLRPPDTALPPGGSPTSGAAAVAIEAPDLCARYSARCVLGVRVGPSPAWLRSRLESIGQRPINNVVDATNFVLWEMGHPLHAFDLERLEGRRIVVRRARPGETLTTLDGTDRTLLPEMLVIADARRPVALAGVMGGRDTEIAATTRDVLLESAWFEPVSVRRTARALGLRTDASHRFERGADPEGTVAALDRAARLIAEIAGGRATDPALDLYPRRLPARLVGFRPERASALLGVALPEATLREAMVRRAFRVEERPGAGAPRSWQVTVPSFRRDVEREVDLIEEVARHRGYDAIPAELPVLAGFASGGGGRGPGDRLRGTIRQALLAAGLTEAINYAMVERDEALLFADPAPAPEPFELENPLQSQAPCLRLSLLPGLLRNVAHNLNHGLPACHLFEIGAVFRPVPGDRPEEPVRVGLVLAGRGLPAHWSLPARDVDLYDLKGAVEVLAERLGLSPLTFSSDRIPFLAAGRSLRVSKGGLPLGVMGEVARAGRERCGLERAVFGAEIDLGALMAAPRAERRFRPLPRFPAVRRDLALVIGREVRFEAIERVVRSVDSLPIADVQVFDRYAGAGIPAGQVGLAIQVTFQSPDRTLAADEVQAALEAMVKRLESALGARLRGAAGD